MLSKTFFSYFSDSDIIRKRIIFNEESKGITLTDAYDSYTRSCIADQKNPLSQLLFARLLHELFPSLRSKRNKTDDSGSKASTFSRVYKNATSKLGKSALSLINTKYFRPFGT